MFLYYKYTTFLILCQVKNDLTLTFIFSIIVVQNNHIFKDFNYDKNMTKEFIITVLERIMQLSLSNYSFNNHTFLGELVDARWQGTDKNIIECWIDNIKVIISSGIQDGDAKYLYEVMRDANKLFKFIKDKQQ